VDAARFLPRAGIGDGRDGFAVEAKSLVGMLLAAVHIRLRRAVHERIEFEFAERFMHLLEVADVEQRMVEADDLIARRAPFPQQRRAQPSAAADDDNFHC